ncbi:glycyl radical protein [Bacilliculturomica massiliensis]|uniref:glycyl radical protein n=1 Tax=Bacilliculturomica massiliensis TaxID=1917867 RepID=UPI0013EF4F18|nr:glycyl radical protein [Bacilliculturomica massiliensis]
MLTNRVEKLRDRMRETKPHICIERAQLMTEFYRQCSCDTPMLRRAKLLKYLLENMTIYIADDELFAGNQAKEYRGVPVFPEFGANWIMDTIDTFSTRPTDPLMIGDEEKKQLAETLEFWRDSSFKELVDEKLTPEVLQAEQLGVLSVGSRTTSTGHVVPNYPRILSIGLSGVIERAKEKIAAVEYVNHDTQRQIDFWQGVIIACEGAIAFAHRYAKLAREMAEKESDEKRKAELLQIAANCGNVPEKAPQSTYEALQFFWFMHLIMQIETNGHSIGLGRFDQTMYPFYKKDLEEGRITFDQCVEMIECLWIKITEIIKVRDDFDAQAFAGYPMWQNCAVGGVTPDGKDAVNEFSFCILQATSEVKTTQPTVSFRYHDNIDKNFFKKALTMIQDGLATPAMFNDKLIIPLVLSKGATIKEARDWSIEGCVENYVTGKTDGRPVVGYINTVKLVEFVLNDGIDPLTGRQVGIKTGDPKTFETFDDFMAAYRRQMEYFTKLMCDAYNVVGACQANMVPALLSSCLVDDCIEKGKTLQEGGAKYNFSGSFITALANAADSMAAVKKFVYDEKKIGFDELKEALSVNFEGHERLRQMLLNGAPKYGNDDDYVDEIARQIVESAVDEVEKYPDSRYGKYVLSVLSQSFNVLQGKSVGATPDGRFAFDALADNASPVMSRDVNGPTAALRSVSKIDQFRPLIGTLLNQKFDPVIVKGEKGLEILGTLVRSYFDEYGEHVQVNVVDEETLRDAQVHPEKHRNLMVRVAGYSAYFIELDKDVQENIIARTAQQGL